MSLLRDVMRAWKPDFRIEQYSLFVFGCLIFAGGADLFIVSQLGTDPLDVFSLGVRKHTGMTVGMAQASFALLCLVVWAIWNRRIPIISPFVTFLFCGSVIDVLLHYRVGEHLAAWLSPYQVMAAGVALCAYGSSLIIMSGIGIRAMDLIAITVWHKGHAPFWLAKGALEMLLLGVGWLLGGPVGIGTVCFLVCVGWFIQPLMFVNRSVLRLPNYGLRKPEFVAVA